MGDLITIGESKFEHARREWCLHRELVYSVENESVECKTCKAPVGPFKAFLILVRAWRDEHENLQRRREEVAELEKRTQSRLLKATVRVDGAWRSRRMVPTCPHCHEAIFAEDGFGGSQINKEIATARRAKAPRGKE